VHRTRAVAAGINVPLDDVADTTEDQEAARQAVHEAVQEATIAFEQFVNRV
jgi:hypothetical protein